ncbi:MAG: hypothetical protein PHF81_10925 [Flavobacterium sp.]|nr:hypothetical protein [Flavobacterium sp.]
MQTLVIQKGDSARIAIVIPADRMDKVEDIVCYVGSYLKYTKSNNTLKSTSENNIFNIDISSEESYTLSGSNEVTVAIDYSDLGVKKTKKEHNLVLNVIKTPNRFNNNSVSELTAAVVTVIINEQNIDASIELANYLKGDKGDDFKYEDFTPEQIIELKKASLDAAENVIDITNAKILEVNNSIQKAEIAITETITATENTILATALAENATENTVLATNNAETATTNANTATTNANNKATLAENASIVANEKATQAQISAENAIAATNEANTAKNNAITATNNAEIATTNANTATTNANNKATLAENASILANEKATQAQISAENAIAATNEANNAKNNAITVTNNAVTATTNANTATTNAIAAASLAENAKGWTPIFIDINDGARIIRKLNDYVGGTGTKPNVNVGKYLKSDGTYTAVISEAIDYKGSTAAGVTAGVVISFLNDRFYGSVTTPENGNITANTTDAQLGITNVIIHKSATAPTFSSPFKKLSGSGNYLVNNVNYIFCTYVTATEIIYIISQRI